MLNRLAVACLSIPGSSCLISYPPAVQPHSARVMAAVAIANLDGLRARSVPPQLRVAAICMSLMSLLNTATAVEGYMALARTLNWFRVKGLGTRNPKSMPLSAASARTLHRRQAEPLATKK